MLHLGGILREAASWSAAGPSRVLSARGPNPSLGRLNGSRARVPTRPRPERRGDTPRRLGASLNSPSQKLPGRLHGQPKQQHPRKEGRCPTLDGVIRANPATGIATTNARACTTSATATITIRATRLMHDLDLPRGDERELVVDRDRVYELNGEDSRTLAAVGAFRVVPEHDLDTGHDTLDHLHEEGLVETVDLGDDERGLTPTKEGRDLLDSHSLERDGEPLAGVLRRRQPPTRDSTTTRISTRRFDRKKPVSETSTATSRSDASSSSRT